MDWHKLQNTLFELDPTDPREDLAKLKAQAQGGASAPVQESVDYLTESAEVAEGSLGLDKDYSISDFAALAGVTTTNEGAMDAFRQGYQNYNKLSALGGNDLAAEPAATPKTKAEPAASDNTVDTSKVTSIKQLSKGDSFTDSTGMVWYYNPNENNWRSKDRRRTISVEKGFKMWKQSKSPRKRNVKEEQIEALESRVAYLESVIESLLEEKQKTGPAGQAKGKDSMPKAKPGRKEHPLKNKLVGEEENLSVKEMLYKALEEFEKK